MEVPLLPLLRCTMIAWHALARRQRNAIRTFLFRSARNEYEFKLVFSGLYAVEERYGV